MICSVQKLIYGTECVTALFLNIGKFSPREGPCSKDLLQGDIANHICQRSSSRRTPSSVFIDIVLSGFIECLLDPAAASRAGQGQISRTLPSPSYTASIQCAERERERGTHWVTLILILPPDSRAPIPSSVCNTYIFCQAQVQRERERERRRIGPDPHYGLCHISS